MSHCSAAVALEILTDPVTADPFVHQEVLEILYHTLWETVHVFLERRELGHDVGDAGFLYPFLGRDKQPDTDAMSEVASSIRMKVAEDAKLREQVARDQAGTIAEAALKSGSACCAEES